MTAASPLKSLSMTAFRGSSTTFTLPFEKGRKLTLIYGENGTGKTTICDAFEFLAYEKVSSLDGYGLGKGLDKYWPSAGRGAANLAVALETGAGTCSGKIVNKKVAVTPAASRPRIELLRHQQILRLIQAQPKERYDAIKRFIDITEFEASEEALRQLGKTLTNERQAAQQAEGQSLQELQGFYETAGSPVGLNAVTWATQKLTQPAGSLDADIAAISTLRTAFDALKPFPQRLQAHQKAQTDANNALTHADAALAAAAAVVTEGTADLLPVLEAGRSYLHAHADAEECPLCGSAEKVEGLAQTLDMRLGNFEVLRNATAAQRKCNKELADAQTATKRLEVDYRKAADAYTAAKDGRAWKAEVQLPASPVPADLSALAGWIAGSDAATQTWPAVEAAWRDEQKFVSALKGAVERYETNITKRNELNALVPRVEEALTHCIEQRQDFTNKIIGAIAQEVGKLYEKVHPGEGLDKIALPLDPNKRASIELEAKFSGLDVPPQAYFSQSHLDTLGLCVFLALAARDKPGETILILDDVLGSVDEPHVERVVGMIYEVSANFRHTIVTTHYRPWREKFRWGVLKPDQVCQFVELRQWTLGDGVALAGSIPEIARLKTLLADPNPDVQAISGKAGVILEALLDFLTLKYACAVPRRAGGAYTLGELLPTVNGKLLAALKVEALDPAGGAPAVTTELKPIIDQISDIAQTRNVMGAHFNTLSFDLYPQDGIKFAKLVEQLADALICPDHGWPNKAKTGSYWNNGGDTRRLHPLQKPNS